jgi:hypothetical protein
MGNSEGLHIDVRPQLGVLHVLFTLSVSFGGAARWEAVRPRNPLIDRRRNYSHARWLMWAARLFCAPPQNRGRVVQEATGGVLIPQHPYIGAHSVEADSSRTAFLFDIDAIRRQS